jgi:hypothetical protein
MLILLTLFSTILSVGAIENTITYHDKFDKETCFTSMQESVKPIEESDLKRDPIKYNEHFLYQAMYFKCQSDALLEGIEFRSLVSNLKYCEHSEFDKNAQDYYSKLKSLKMSIDPIFKKNIQDFSLEFKKISKNYKKICGEVISKKLDPVVLVEKSGTPPTTDSKIELNDSSRKEKIERSPAVLNEVIEEKSIPQATTSK